MASVKLENLTKRFDDVVALDGINLDIADQEFFVLLGQTGAGKTTALRCIAGLERAEEGAIFFDSQQVDEFTPAERDVAFVFQSHILYPHLTVYENMAFPHYSRVNCRLMKSRCASKRLLPCYISNLFWDENRAN